MLGSIAEFENAIRKERQTGGIAKAKELGIKFGAKPKLTQEQIIELKTKRKSGAMVKDLMDEYGLGKTTVYRLLGTADLG